MSTAYVGRHRRTSISAQDLVHLTLNGHLHIGKHRALRRYCDWCDRIVRVPVRDDEEVAWLHSGAATYCSQECLDAHDESRINAAGNDAS